MPNLRKLMLLTRSGNTPVRVYDKERNTYLILNPRLGSDYPGETHVIELGACSGEICAYTDLPENTIKHWKTKYGCN